VEVNNIDLGLAVLCSIAKRDETLNTTEIAEICDCSQQHISNIIRKALKKLRGHAGEKLKAHWELSN
jgi:DNA-directed RNA polymerase sigma subunit (sigma70/sigma32)